MRYRFDQHGSFDDLFVAFHFQWENSSPNPVLLLNVASHLIVKGYWEADAFNSFLGEGHCFVQGAAVLKIFEWWNQPPTSPLWEHSQAALIVQLDVYGPHA